MPPEGVGAHHKVSAQLLCCPTKPLPLVPQAGGLGRPSASWMLKRRASVGCWVLKRRASVGCPCPTPPLCPPENRQQYRALLQAFPPGKWAVPVGSGEVLHRAVQMMRGVCVRYHTPGHQVLTHDSSTSSSHSQPPSSKGQVSTCSWTHTFWWCSAGLPLQFPG